MHRDARDRGDVAERLEQYRRFLANGLSEPHRDGAYRRPARRSCDACLVAEQPFRRWNPADHYFVAFAEKSRLDRHPDAGNEHRKPRQGLTLIHFPAPAGVVEKPRASASSINQIFLRSPDPSVASRIDFVCNKSILLSFRALHGYLAFYHRAINFRLRASGESSVDTSGGLRVPAHLGIVAGRIRMRIATWNVNSIKQRLDAAVAWLKERQPDVVCLQETKCVDAAFPRDAFEGLGYNVAIHGQKAFNGVAVLSKLPFDEVTPRLPGDDDDDHARFLEVAVSAGGCGMRIASIYLPNGNPPQTEKYPYKIRWMDRLFHYAQERMRHEEPLVLAGDYNVIPAPADVFNPAAWTGDALFLPRPAPSFGR